MNECNSPDHTDSSHEHKNPIITHADAERWPLLEMRSNPCDIPISPDDEQAIGYMDSLLSEMGDSAAGLAAIQIGYPKRIFLLRKNGENSAYINPIIVNISKEFKRDGEACLSLPGFGGVFERPKSITIEFTDIAGNTKQETFSGFMARAVCHEMDHLNGILITKHLERIASRRPLKTKFGMKITPHSQKKIARRRAQKRRAEKARRHAKAIGR